MKKLFSKISQLNIKQLLKNLKLVAEIINLIRLFLI